MGPKSDDWYPYKKAIGRQSHPGKMPCDGKGSDTTTSQVMPRIADCHQKLKRDKEDPFPRSFGENVVLPAFHSGHLASRTVREQISLSPAT